MAVKGAILTTINYGCNSENFLIPLIMHDHQMQQISENQYKKKKK